MLNADMLLDAMQGVRPENVHKAEVFLGYGEASQSPPYVRRRLWSTILVAAILISLFTVSAYALGLFQISGRSSKESFSVHFEEQSIQWDSEYVFTFAGPEECPEVHFKTTWAPNDDYWYPASWAADWTQLLEGRELYNEQFDIYMPSCVVDVLYASQFVDGGAMLLLGFQSEDIHQETWGELQVLTFSAQATHAIDAEQTEFPTGNFVILFHPEQGWIIGVRGYDSMENMERIARGLIVEPTGNTVRQSDFENPYAFCDIYIG